MPAATLVGEPSEGERRAWVEEGLEALNKMANEGDPVKDVGAGIIAIVEQGRRRGIGRVATGFAIPTRPMPQAIGNGLYTLN